MLEEKENEVVEETLVENENASETEEVKEEQTKETKEESVSEPEEAPKLEVDNNYENSPLIRIEEERTEFLKKYKRQSVYKLLVGASGIALIIFAFLLVPSIDAIADKNAVKISIMVVCGVIAVVGMFLYNYLSKRAMGKKMKHYFHTYYSAVTEYTLEEVVDKENVQCDPDQKITEDQFKKNNLWKDVVQVGSRALTTIKYHDLEISLADAAGQIRENKRMKPIFVGKYLITKTSYDNENPVIIYLKGDKRAIPPTNLDSIKCVMNDNKMAIYSNNPQWSRFITKKVKDTLGKLKTKNDLIDVTISIQCGVAYICLGYDDSLMVLPLEQPLNARPIKQFKKDIIPTLEFIELINK